MSWLLVPWLQGHLIMHEPALILFQTGFHISTQITILHPMSKSKVRGSYMKTKIRKDQLTKEEMEVFNTINSKAKGLNTSLLDFHRTKLEEDLLENNPELFIATELNNSIDSPWYKQLDQT